MIQLNRMQVTLPTRDLAVAARFYTEVLEFHIVNQGSNAIVLEQGHFRLSLIKAEPNSTPSSQPMHLTFTVSQSGHVNEVIERVKRFNLPMLEETHQLDDGTQAFTCLGPDGLMIEIASEPPPAQPAPPVTKPQAVQPTAPVSPPQTPTPLPPTPSGRPTKADWYLLEAQERLAKMKEEMASLSTSFSATDIAGTLDEMRQKIARGLSDVTEKLTTPSGVDRSAPPRNLEEDREKKRREAEEALARYKQTMGHQRIEEPVKPEEEGLKPVKKTLGPAPDEERK